MAGMEPDLLTFLLVVVGAPLRLVLLVRQMAAMEGLGLHPPYLEFLLPTLVVVAEQLLELLELGVLAVVETDLIVVPDQLVQLILEVVAEAVQVIEAAQAVQVS
jgi:hypothetical protein